MINTLKFLTLLFLLAGCNTDSTQSRQEQIEALQEALQDMPDFENFAPRGTFLKAHECKVHTSDTSWLENFPDGLIPWVSIEDPESDLANLVDADKVMTESQEAILIIDYPVSTPVEIKITTENEMGFTLGEIVLIVGREYKRIYDEDYQSAMEQAEKDEDSTLMNGIYTKGKYGIWGHDISELDLSSVEIWQDENGDILIYLQVIS